MKKWLIIGIVIVAFILRFWNLTSLPYRPDGDEVAFGYYGWSLLHFGTDEYGKILPMSFSSIGDFKYPGLAYLNTIPALVFGRSDLTTRFTSAASGVLLVITVYFLVRRLFANNFLAITSAAFVALSPWVISESRLGYETMPATLLTTLGLYFLLKILESRKLKHPRLAWAGVFLLLLVATLTYAAVRIFIPLILLALIMVRPEKKKISILLVALTTVIVVSLIPASNRGRAGEDLWKGISSGEQDRLQQLYIGAGTASIKLPPRLTWLFHNKYRLAVFDFLERYAFHFSPSFLFFRGEANLEQIPDMGVLLFVDVLFLPVGMFYLLKRDERHSGKFILIWLLIAPIASALTVGGSAMNRASLMIVPLAIISAFGFYTIYGFFKPSFQRLILVIAIIAISASTLYALNQIFVQKPVDRPWYKRNVNETLTKEILNLQDKYQAVVTPDDDYVFFLFYGGISPKQFLSNADIESAQSAKWERVDRLGKIHFKMPFNCPKTGKLNVLYVCQGQDVPQNSKIVKTIYYPDGLPAYALIEFFPISQLKSPLPELPKDFKYMVEIEKSPQYPDGLIPDSYASLW